jgi:hypothetical protein
MNNQFLGQLFRLGGILGPGISEANQHFNAASEARAICANARHSGAGQADSRPFEQFGVSG